MPCLLLTDLFVAAAFFVAAFVFDAGSVFELLMLLLFSLLTLSFCGWRFFSASAFLLLLIMFLLLFLLLLLFSFL